MTPQSPTPSWVRWTATALLIAGTVLRLRQYLETRSLWLDEVSLALNIVSRSYSSLLHSLDFAAVVPVPFLWVMRAATDLFGPGEKALRAEPLVAGLLVAPAVWCLARRVLSARWSLVPLGMSTFSLALIYYSNEAKQYSVDAFAATVLVWLALRVVDAVGERTAWLALAVSGVGALFFSMPSVFVIAVIVVTLARHVDFRSRSLSRGWFLLCIGLWAVAFCVSYASTLHAGGSVAYHFATGGPVFLDLRHPVDLSHWQVIAEALQQDLVGVPDPTHHELLLAVVVLMISGLGVASLWRTLGPTPPLLLLGPLAAGLAASGLHLYPIVARTALFAIPSLLVLIAAGMRAACQLPSRGRAVAVAAGVSLLIVPGMSTSLERGFRPRHREDLRPLLVALNLRRTPDEPVYVYARAIESWTYYSIPWSSGDRDPFELIRTLAAHEDGPCFENGGNRQPTLHEGDSYTWRDERGLTLFGLSSGAMMSGVPAPSDRIGPRPGWAQNEARRIKEAARPTIWVIFTHVVQGEDRGLLEAIEAAGGVQVSRITAEGASIVQYRFPATALD